MPESPTSPCIKVCAVDGQTGWCLGCGRTLNEIGGWIKMDDETKSAVIAELPARKERLVNLGKLKSIE